MQTLNIKYTIYLPYISYLANAENKRGTWEI